MRKENRGYLETCSYKLMQSNLLAVIEGGKSGASMKHVEEIVFKMG